VKGSGTTVFDLFALAIAAEEAAEALYEGLAGMFAENADVADFWKQYAAEERGHAKWLLCMRDNLSAEKLAASASVEILERAHRALRMPVEQSLVRIENLQDAYELVSDVENSETNAVFEFILEHYPIDDEVLSFLQKQLDQHVSRLIFSFPGRYGSANARLQVRAQHST
jgi:rubrerythrin